jgi:hypothetical protein
MVKTAARRSFLQRLDADWVWQRLSLIAPDRRVADSTKFPVNFPVSREFEERRRVRLGLRPPPVFSTVYK